MHTLHTHIALGYYVHSSDSRIPIQNSGATETDDTYLSGPNETVR